MKTDLPVTILYADDDRDDGEIFIDVVAELAPTVQVAWVPDGTEVLVRLKEMNALPHLIVLDMNMPRMTGLACLIELQKQARFRQIPVIMYSTTGHQDTIDSAIKNGAADYRVKSNSYIGMKAALADLLTKYHLA
jgi:CheY-like chemotaxis protein